MLPSGPAASTLPALPDGRKVHSVVLTAGVVLLRAASEPFEAENRPEPRSRDDEASDDGEDDPSPAPP